MSDDKDIEETLRKEQDIVSEAKQPLLVTSSVAQENALGEPIPGNTEIAENTVGTDLRQATKEEIELMETKRLTITPKKTVTFDSQLEHQQANQSIEDQEFREDQFHDDSPFFNQNIRSVPSSDLWRRGVTKEKLELDTVDPLMQLEHLDKSYKKYKAQNEVLTPMNFSQIIQTMNHPHQPGIVIQIRLINKNVLNSSKEKKISAPTKDEMQPEMRCLECRGGLRSNSIKDSQLQVFCKNPICKEKITDPSQENSYFVCESVMEGQSCKEGEEQVYCIDCVTQHWLRYYQTEKTKQQFRYRTYEFQYNFNNENLNPHSKLRQLLKSSQHEYKITPRKYGKNAEKLEVNKNVSISFWNYNHFNADKKQTDIEPFCIHEILVPLPQYLKRSGTHGQMKLQEFLFLTQDKQNFFFFTNRHDESLQQDQSFHHQTTKYDECDYQLNFINATYQFKYDKKQRKQQTFDLEYKKVAVFNKNRKEKIWKILKECFRQDKLDGSKASLLPTKPSIQLIKDHVILGTTYEDESNLEAYKLYFINYKEEKLDYEIKDAKVVVKQLCEASDPDVIYYIGAKCKKLRAKGIQKQQSISLNLSQKPITLYVQDDGSQLPPMLHMHTIRHEDDQIDTDYYTCFELVGFNMRTRQEVGPKIKLAGVCTDVELQAYMHFKNKRVTLIATNVNWLTLELRQDGTSKPIFQQNKKMVRDVVMTDLFGKPTLMAHMHAHFEMVSRQDAIEKFDLMLINLDDQVSLKQAAFQRSDYMLENAKQMSFQLPLMFRSSNQPYKLMPFSKLDDTNYISQIFYLDLVSGFQQCFYIVGQVTAAHNEQQHLAPEKPLKVSQRHLSLFKIDSTAKFYVDYPILLYTGPEALGHELYLVNLQKNIQQKKLKLEFPFLCFMDSSRVTEHSCDCVIDFIVSLNSELKVFRLRVCPWTNAQDDQITLTEIYTFRFKENQQKNMIKKCTLLSFQIPSSADKRHALIIQTTTQVLQYSSHEQGEITPAVQTVEDDCYMAPLMMRRARDKCYFVQRSRMGDEIICLYFDDFEFEIKSRSIYKQKDMILQLNLDSEELLSKEHINMTDARKIILLDSAYKLKVLMYENRKKQTSHVNLIEVKTIDLTNQPIKRLMRSLQLIPWQEIVISEHAIYCNRLHNLDKNPTKNQKFPKITRQSVLYSLQANSWRKRDYMGFANLKKSDVAHHDQHKTIFVQSMKSIPKVIQLIQEKKFFYFSTMTSPTIRQINIIGYKHLNMLRAELNLSKRYILVSFESAQKDNYTLVYKQENLMLQDIWKGIKVEERLADPLDHVSLMLAKFDSDSHEKVISVDNSGKKPTYTILYDKDMICDKHTGNNFYFLMQLLYDLSPKQVDMHLEQFQDKQKQKQILLQQAFKVEGTQSISIGDGLNLDKEYFVRSDDIVMLEQQGYHFLTVTNREFELENKEQIFSVDIPYSNTIYEEFKTCQKYIFMTVTDCDETKTSQQTHAIYFYFKNFSCRMNQAGKKLVLQDYIVGTSQNLIWFVKTKFVKVYDQDEQFKLEEYRIPESKIKIIDLSQFFLGPKTLSTNFRILPVVKRDYYQVVNSKDGEETKQPNVIQICFVTLSMMWDLDKNQEVTTLFNIDTFDNTQNYVRTGFTYYRLEPLQFGEDDRIPKTNLRMLEKNVKFFQTNRDGTLICVPGSSLQQACMLRPFSMNDIQQLKHIKNLINNNGESGLQKTNFSLPLLNCNIYGQTVYSLFHKTPLVYQIILEIISDMCYSPETADDNDTIMLNQIFYTVCQPFKPPKEHEIKTQGEYDPDGLFLSRKGSQLTSILSRHKTRVANKQKTLRSLRHHEEEQENKPIKVQFDSIYKDEIEKNPHNLVQWMILKDNSMFDPMIKIMLKSREVSLRSLIQSFEHFKRAFKIQCETVDDFMERSNTNNILQNNKIMNVEWSDPDRHQVVFAMNTAQLSAAKIKKKTSLIMNTSLLSRVPGLQYAWNSINKSSRSGGLVSAKVNIVDISWLNGHLKEFYKFLANQESPKIYDNILIKTLLKQQNYTSQIAVMFFLPYIVYMILCIIYFLKYIPNERPEDMSFWNNDYLEQSINRLLICLLSTFLLLIEIDQLWAMKLQYFGQLWNYGNVSLVLLNLFIVLEHSMRIFNIGEALIYITMLANVQLWLMFYYWWRLNYHTAFYVKMLIEVVLDLKYFILLYSMMIITFSTTGMILETYFDSQNEILENERYKPMYAQQTSAKFLDAFINQWILGLGEFVNLENYGKNNNDVQWVLFVCATFFTNIVFLNMLIAIMQNTFERITEKKERNGAIQQTELYADFISRIRVDQEIDSKKYLYIIIPIDGSDAQLAEMQEKGNQTEQIMQMLCDMETRQGLSQRKDQNVLRMELRKITETINTIIGNQKRMQNQLFPIQQELALNSPTPKKTPMTTPRVLQPHLTTQIEL